MKRLRSYFSAVALSLCVALGAVAPAVAATTSSGLSITPRKDLKIEAGGSLKDKLTISNLNRGSSLQLNLRMIDFSFADETGTPKLMIADNAPQTTWSLKPFTTLPKSITVPAGQTRTIDYTISIPKGQGAGSYYSAVQYAAGSDNSGNVNLNASGVSLMFVSVPGITKEKLTLKKLGAYQPGLNNAPGNYVFLAFDKPTQIAYNLQNDGNVAESPAGSITMKHMFGQEISIENANGYSQLALRGQDRRFTTCIVNEVKQVEIGGSTNNTKVCKAPSLLPGRYTIDLSLFYGQNGNNTQEVNGSASFWYLPVWFIASVIAIFLGIAYVVWRIKRAIKGVKTGTRRGFRVKR